MRELFGGERTAFTLSFLHLFYNIPNFVCYIIKPSGGSALVRECSMSQATALGARMCQGTFFILIYQTFGLDYTKDTEI